MSVSIVINLVILMSPFCFLSCNNLLFWFSSVFFLFFCESHIARIFLEWISIMGQLKVRPFSLYLAENLYFFLEHLHPTTATHYCLPKCTTLGRKQMFPITNDIYQLVSGTSPLQNWSSLGVTVMNHYWISQCFQSETKCNGWYD